MGHSSSGIGLVLIDNTSNAYLIENAGGNDYFVINTTNSSESMVFGNATENPFYSFLGSGDVRLGSQIRLTERSGNPTAVADTIFLFSKDDGGTTQLYARDSAGTVHQITPAASTTGLTGTTSRTWTINNDATSTDEDPELQLQGGTGAAVFETDFIQDSSATLIYVFQKTGGTRVAPIFQVGLAGSTSNFGATLRFAGGSGTSAMAEDIAMVNAGSSTPALQFSSYISCPGAGTNSERYGTLAVAGGLNATALGKSSTAAGANATALGNSADASVTGATAVGASSSAAGDNSVVVGASGSTTGGGDEAILIGRSSSTSQPAIIIANSYSNTTASVCVLGSPTTPITTLIVGEGDTDATPPDTVFRPTNAAAANQAGSKLTVSGSRSRGSGASGAVVVTTGNSGASSGTLNTETERIRFFQNSPNVGIGDFSATSSSAQVHVLASDSTSFLLLLDQDGAGDPAIRFDASSESWTVGVDNSNGDLFAISESTSIGGGLERIWIEANAGAIHRRTHADGGIGEQHRENTEYVQTTNNSYTAIWSYALAERENAWFRAMVTAQGQSTTQHAAYRREEAYYRESGGSSTVIPTGGSDTADRFDREDVAAYDARFALNGNTVELQVRGETGHTVDWCAYVEWQVRAGGP